MKINYTGLSPMGRRACDLLFNKLDRYELHMSFAEYVDLQSKKDKQKMKSVPFDTLEGKTVKAIKYTDEQIVFTISDSESYILHHHQDCCESVIVEDICGDLLDLIGEPILSSEEASNRDREIVSLVTDGSVTKGISKEFDGSETWTFYKLSTIKGSVTIRWYGCSNGYYSEEVSFERMEDKNGSES